jgi:hypothetical protein
LLKTRSILDLKEILAAGGGLDIELTSKTLDELMILAAAAKTGGCELRLRGQGHRETQELRMIARAGGGHVVFVEI